MARAKQSPAAVGAKQTGLLDLSDTLRTAPAVPLIRQEVEQWRAQGYSGITATTKQLLAWWFKNDHKTPQGLTFRYYPAQREAIETLIYVFEVKKVRRRGELLLAYAKGRKIALPTDDDFARYALKMATGSGKTKVMALVIAWQYFNAVRGEGDEYSKTFLLLAPNVIVLERLATDFQGGKVFKTDPVIPPQWKMLWDFDVYVRGDSERMRSEGALYLTNIQQLYDRGEETAPINPVADLLGPAPTGTLQPVEGFVERVVRRGDCLIINDEGHHANDQAVVWNAVIRSVHTGLKVRGLTGQLDFSATPRQSDGSLFTWTIYDYPLKQAILDRVVKRPVKGVAQGIVEAPSDKASVRYEPYLVASVERWQEYQAELEVLAKRPILFVMMYDTKSADDVAEWLHHKYAEHFAGDKLLVIHTDKTGEVTKADLDVARKAARSVDENTSPVNCIVSVLMLREGWDVNNVTVVVGLRPFSAKANILPEQAVGRGLRLMFRNQTGYHEHVDVIGNSNFMQVIEDLEKEEGIKLDTFDYGKKKTALVIQTLHPVTERIGEYEIRIPTLTPRIERKKDTRSVILSLEIGKLKLRHPLTTDTTVAPPDTFTYEGIDVITDETLFTKVYTMPQARTSGDVIAFYAQVIAQDLKLPAQFAVLVPKIEQFLREKAFGKAVDLNTPAVLQALSKPAVLMFTEKVFLSLLRPKLTEEHTPTIEGFYRALSTTPPFAWSGKVADVKKTLFNLTPCDNDFEQRFANFLDGAKDVAAFANLGNLPQPVSIEYLDSEANLRSYEPDFVVREAGGTYLLMETKGREDADVALKDARAKQWCADVSELTREAWEYVKVPQKEYEKLKPSSLNELVSSLHAGGPLFVEE